MPPNAKGGKNYKKGKKGGQPDIADLFLERKPDQMIGRVIKILGNRNMLVYCNDNQERICHICGKMKGRVWVETGDIVLCSLRDFGSETDRGDIIGKYAPEHMSRLRKDDTVNKKLFVKLEQGIFAVKEEDDIFESGEEGSDEEGEKAAPATASAEEDLDIDGI